MKQLKYVLLLPLMYVTISVMAQDSTFLNREKKARADSVLKVEKKGPDNLYKLNSKNNETKGKSGEARRVERNANDVERESRIAYRSEQRAQKARNKADKQATKVTRARVKSNN